MSNQQQIESDVVRLVHSAAANEPCTAAHMSNDESESRSSPLFTTHRILKQSVLITAYMVSAWIVFSGIANKSNMDNYQSSGIAEQTTPHQTLSTTTTTTAVTDPTNAGISNTIITNPTMNIKDSKTKRGNKNDNENYHNNNPKDRKKHKRLRKISREDVADPPFEQIWPNYKLPNWARKNENYGVPDEKSICFVHVGKAGGSAVGCSLGFSLHCDSSTQVKGVLPKMTTNTFHKDVYNCHDNSAYFLFVIRDPIDRARSAFNYDRPDFDCDDDPSLRIRQFYMDCPFWTMEEMVRNGLLNSNTNSYYNSTEDDMEATEARATPTSETCKARAINSLQGTALHGSHLYYNYQYYYESVPQDAPILVIRNEHLVEDWNNIEGFVGGKKERLNSEHSVPKENSYQYSEDDLYISDESQSALCHVLCNEIQIYKKILLLAQNLNHDEIQVSMAELEAKCPNETNADSCPDALPDIGKKLTEDRGYAGTQKRTNHYILD